MPGKGYLLSMFAVGAVCMLVFSSFAAAAPIGSIVVSGLTVDKDVLEPAIELYARKNIQISSCGFPGGSCAFAVASGQDASSDTLSDDFFSTEDLNTNNGIDTALDERDVKKIPISSCGFPGGSCSFAVPVVEESKNNTAEELDVITNTGPGNSVEDLVQDLSNRAVKIPISSCGFPGGSCSFATGAEDDVNRNENASIEPVFDAATTHEDVSAPDIIDLSDGLTPVNPEDR